MPRKPKTEKHKGVYEKNPGSGIWWIRYTNAHGKRVTESIGRQSDAVTIYQQRMTEKRTGELIPIGKSAKGIKFSALVDAALKYSQDKHKDRRNFEQRLGAARKEFGDRVADSITPAEVDEWLTSHNWTSATFNRYKAAISLAYKLGRQNRRVTSNPARDVSQKQESIGRVRYLLPEEETRLRKAIMENRPHCIYQLDVALGTGMRKGEQFSVTWGQVDTERGYIHLDTTKNGSSRYIHLSDDVLASLKALKQEHDGRGLKFDTLFFDRRNSPIRDPREWFRAACVEAKISGVSWHILRHTFASRLIMAGVDLKTAQTLMGHKTIAMTARYAHLSSDHLKIAVNRLSKPASVG